MWPKRSPSRWSRCAPAPSPGPCMPFAYVEVLLGDRDGVGAGDVARLGLEVQREVRAAVLDDGEVLLDLASPSRLAQVADRLRRHMGAAAGAVDHDLLGVRAAALLDRALDVGDELARRVREMPESCWRGSSTALDLALHRVDHLPARGELVDRGGGVLLEKGVVPGRHLVLGVVVEARVAVHGPASRGRRVDHVVLAAVGGVAEDQARDRNVESEFATVRAFAAPTRMARLSSGIAVAVVAEPDADIGHQCTPLMRQRWRGAPGDSSEWDFA